MKKYFSTIAASLCVVLSAQAQDCSNYLFLQKNKTIENTIYSKKGDVNGRQVYTVTDVTTSGGIVSGNISSEMFDRKDKSMAKANSVVRCNGGIMMIDMKMLLPQQQQEQYGGKMEATSDSIYMEYPAGMKAGDELKDGVMTLNINNSGMGQNLNMHIYERKVELQESVTTPAGTWMCFKINYKCKMGVKMGPINIPFNFEGSEWYAPGVGIIKSQSKYGGTMITSIK